MKMMKNRMFAALFVGLLAVLPMASAWAYSYNYSATLTGAANPTGAGSVYVADTKENAKAKTNLGTYTKNGESDSSGNDVKVTLYAYAVPNAGYEFKGWTDATATDGDTCSVSLTCTSSAKEKSASVTANFAKIQLPSFGITFVTSDAGTYTVDGSAPANKTGLTEATSVKLSSTDPNFLNWKVNDAVINDNPYTATCIADTTISAEFLTADQVAEATTFADLTAALANDGKKKITIPSGTEIVIVKGASVTVPNGKQLVVDGALNVIGTVNNSGAISGNGKLIKVSKIISQGEIQTLYTANGEECPKITEAHHSGVWPKYRKTTVEVNTPSVTGNAVGCATTGWGVYFNGKVTSISKQSPVAVKVNVNTANAVNDITTVVENGDVDSINAQGAYVLFDNCSIKGPPHSSDANRLNFNGTVDCAGKKVTFGLKRTYSDFAPIILNGTVDFQPTTDFQNAAVLAFGCSSVTIKNIKNTSGKQYFYDCGTPSSACSITLQFQSSSSRTAYFYNGHYKYTFSSSNDGASKCYVYGGSYTSDPTSYIPSPLNDELYAPKEGDFFVVQPKPVAEYVVSVGDAQYESLEEALEKAPAGSTITLIAGVDLTDKTVTVASGKQVTIDLNKHQITGGKIVNNGTLVITDYATANESVVEADIENNGTLDVIFGTYKGNVVNKAGTLTIHNGAFDGSIGSNGGTLALKGGHFTQNVTDLVTAENTQVFVFGGKYYVCEMPNGTFYDKTVSSVLGYGVTPYTTADYNLLDNYVGGKSSRSEYSDAEWTRLAELLPFYEVYNNRRLDPTLAFDRDVAANSMKFNVQASQTLTRALGVDVAAGEKYRTLSEVLGSFGASGKTYKALWDDGIKEVAVSFSNTSTENAGTICTLMVELWETARAPDYSSNGHLLSNTVCVVGQEYFVIDAGDNQAMIRPATGAATFYADLASAMGAVADNGTVMLANDCTTALSLPKAGTYTFDPMCFAMTDAAPVVGEGLFIKSTSTADSAAVALKAGALATTYVVAQKVAQVGEAFYDNLNDAIAAANGAVVTLLAATDETVSLAENASFTLALADDVTFSDSQVVGADGCIVQKETVTGGTLYKAVKDVIETEGGTSYTSVTEAIAGETGDEISITVKANVTEEVEVPQGKTLKITVAEGVEPTLTVNPGEGAFLVETKEGATTMYEAKRITETPVEPTDGVIAKEVSGGNTNDAPNAAELVAELVENAAIQRVDNTGVPALDKIEVTPTTIIAVKTGDQGVIEAATFDVTPKAKEGHSLGETMLKFRLPVDAKTGKVSAKVSHNGAFFGVLPIASETVGGIVCKFIEVESNAFSPYGYELLSGATDPVAIIDSVGYATLAEAVAAVQDGQTIVLLQSCVAKGPSYANKGTITFTAANEDVVLDISDMTGPVSAAGTSLVFKNMTLNGFRKGDSWYNGWQGAGEYYEGCTINGCTTLYSPNVTFKDCVFNNEDNEYSLYDYGADKLVLDGCTFNCAGKAIKVYNEGARAFDVFATNTTFNASEVRKAAFQLDVNYGITANIVVDQSCTLAGDGYTTGVEGGDPWIYSENEPATSTPETARGQFALGTNIVRDENGKITGGTFERISAGLIAEGFEGKPDPTGKIVVEEIPVTEILTAADLVAFSAAVNGGKTFEGEKVVLTADIDMTGIDFQPIGNVAAYPSITFKGTFDGQNHKISNLKASDFTPNYATAGLFGSLGKGAVVQNLTLVDPEIESSHYAGAIVGYISEGPVKVINCSVEGGSVTSTPELIGGEYDNGDKVGGILGYGAGNGNEITECSIEGMTITAYRDIGGIAGCANASLNGNSVSETTIVQDNTYAYKSETITTVSEICGRDTGAPAPTVANETSEVEIVRFNPVAKVGGVGYETLQAALDAAQAGDTVALLKDIEGVTGTFEITKAITLDGNGHKIVAAVNENPRDMITAYLGARVMFQVRAADGATFKNLTVDGGTTHYYTFLAETKGGVFTVENTQWLHGGEASVGGTAGVGYGAAIHVNGGNLLVDGTFHACTGGKTAGVFPFTGILYDDGGIHFNDGVTATIGDDLLLVGMTGAPDVSTEEGKAYVESLLAAMNVPAGFAPYTLKLSDDSSLAFTGASPLGWNDIIDYGKQIMDVAAEAMGFEDLDKETTPVEVGLLADTALPNVFTFGDTNLTVNGNGNALSGTIKYTDNAGLIENIELGANEEKPLVLDMTEVSKPVQLGGGIKVNDLIIKMTPEQATAGTPVVTWPTDEGVEAPANEEGVKVQLVNDVGAPTGETKDLVWDDEMGLAYIGPVEARLTGPTHPEPIYTSLAEALDQAAQSGDTVTLMMDIENFTGTVEIEKSLTFDGANHKIAAKPVTTHRDIFNAYVQSSSMLKLKTGTVTLKNITLDGDASHAYTYLVSADNGGVSLTTENVNLLNGGELMGDETGAVKAAGAGYGAAVHLNNGATMVVKDGFTACTGGTTDGVFPFTGILVDSNGANVKFDLTEDSNANPTVGIGGDLLLVGMPVAIDAETAQAILDEMKVPTRFIPYTLTLGDGTDYAFTGASPLGWNDIIDYGKEIMDVSATMGYEGLNKETTPVEVGLLTDTVLPDTFKFEDSNFTVNGNGNALSGTIEYTDEAGQIENIELGTTENPLVLDMTNVENPVHLGGGIKVTDLVIKMTPEQAKAGTPVVTWTSNAAPEGEEEVKVELVDEEGESTGEEKDLIWDEELRVAYIGPVEARLTGPTHPAPIYTSLAEAIAQAAQSGDTVTLMTNLVDYVGTQEIAKSLTLDGAGHKIAAKPVTTHRDVFHAWTSGTSMLKLQSGEITLKNITLDGDASHAYTYLVSADNGGITLTTENVTLLHGGELMGDGTGVAVGDGAGYGAAVHLNNGATMVVKDGFYACTSDTNTTEVGVFPFTGILVDSNGVNVSFDLETDSNENPTVGIGSDLLLVGMPMAIDAETAQGILDEMKVPTRFIPYTLTLGDGSTYAFTGASPLGWNDIIDYGKQIMDVSTAIGFEGLDKETTPVEVGLLTDTVLPDTFTFEDSNFTVNGNGSALSGTIKYTDNAGLIENIELGADEGALVLDMTGVTKPVQLGEGIEVTDLVIKMTEEQAKAGKTVIVWPEDADEPKNPEKVTVDVVDPVTAESTGETKNLIWDDEMHVAYIGPAEVRLTGLTHDQPIYTSLAEALAAAKDGDAIKLLEDVALTANVTFDKGVTFDLAGKEIGGETATVTVGEGKTLTINDSSEDGSGVIASAIVNDGGTLVITNGTFEQPIYASDKVTDPTTAFALSGGTYSENVIRLAGGETVPLNDVCVEGYEAVYNGNNTWSVVPDRDTVAFEPKADDAGRIEIVFDEGAGSKVPVFVSDAWVRENFAGYYGSEATKPAAAEINAKLDEKQENGMRGWQNYLLGFDGSETAKPLSPDGGDSEDKENVIVKSFRPVTLPKLDMGVTVSFVLLKGTPTRNAAGEIVSWKWDEVQTLDKPEFPVALTTLEAETYWRIKTVFRANKVVVHEETAN